MQDTTPLYPLAVVAADLDCGIRQLLQRAGDQVVVNEHGLRCLPGTVVRLLVAEKAAHAENDAKRRAEGRERARVVQDRRNISRARAAVQRAGEEAATAAALEAASRQWNPPNYTGLPL